MKHIQAILWKQLKDTLRNKEILIQYVMFPVLTIIMENAIEIPNLPNHFFANLFGVMYVGMAPLISIAAIISEEKEKNTLRVLQLSNVKSMEYLAGNAIYIWLICMIGSFVIGVAGGYSSVALIYFMLIMAVGHFCSIFIGATIGLISKNQMAASSYGVPAMMFFSFLPMISMFNDGVQKFAKIVYSEQIYLLINDISNIGIGRESGIIMLCNVLVVASMFIVVYRKVF